MNALGTHFITNDGRPALRFARDFDHPLEKVWRALTQAEHLRHWFPANVDLEVMPGARLRFEIRQDAKAHYEIPDDQVVSYGELIRADAPYHLEYTWEGEILRWELQAGDQGGCRLLFTHILDPEYTIPAASEVGAGWHVGFEMLTGYLDGQPLDWSPWQRQAQIRPDYTRAFEEAM